ncbi:MULTISPECIES: lysine--tRNA ligase [Holospora]|uniref:Lysine--tRNA ligase n=2 Tax=Holospora TaxID=44747 RepID=A0A061JHZ6_9PROT|nr:MULTISPECIES: lysine--tRNA ligase [Holospora]ETZ04584.1 lysine--tRNA ligase [Holospora undulata HU1]GAJ45961.1 lysine--tRNA ligase [Holospora elegans E1]
MKTALWQELMSTSLAWPFEEARRLIQREKSHPKSHKIFSTGYGPSGLPHMGTFGEVLRTTMVRFAFSKLCPSYTSELICVSDDMDGLRKVPGNIPNQDKMKDYIGFPLTKVIDPFQKYSSFAAHNNAKLQKFLDHFGFDYKFLSATQAYQSGRLDDALLKVLKHHQEILEILLPTLREERRKTYSPFLPISPISGKVLQVSINAYNVDRGTISFYDEDGSLQEVTVTGGHCKLQWKVDWGTRWYALGVDYEMCGKDLIESAEIGKKVCRVLGGIPPEILVYEHFLDKEGRKISKSIGNGLTMEEWLRYAPLESLSYFMYPNPKRAKRIFFDVIPRAADEYLELLDSYPLQSPKEQLENPVWHIHQGNPPTRQSPITFSMLLNLVNICHAETPEHLWHFIQRYTPDAVLTEEMKAWICHGIAYYQDRVLPNKTYAVPLEEEKKALLALASRLQDPELIEKDADFWQHEVYEIGKNHGFTQGKNWFSLLYKVLLGQNQGPRMGTFIQLCGPLKIAEDIQARCKINVL